MTRRLANCLPEVSLVAALLVTGAGNFAYHALVGQRLDPEAYATLAALLAVLTTAAVPAAALETAVAREVARRPDQEAPAVRALLSRLAPLALLGALAVAAGTSLLLPGGSAGAAILAAASVPFMVLGLVARGVLLGRLRHGAVAAVVLLGVAVKCTLGAVLAGEVGLEGATAAVVGAEAALAAGFWAFAAGRLSWRRGPALAVSARVGGLHVGAQVGFWVLVALDLVVARRLLDPVTAGQYAAASTVAKAALFAPLAVVGTLYPRFGRADASPTLLRTTLLLVAVVGALPAAGLSLVGEDLIQAAYGSEFVAGLTAPLGLVAALLGCLAALTQYHMALGRRAALLPWLGVAVVPALLPLTGGQPGRLVAAEGVAVALCLLLSGCAVRPGRRPQAERLRLAGEPELDVTVVIPFFNPGPALTATVASVLEELGRNHVTHEVIAVSDGSTDGSAAALRELAHPLVQVVDLAGNQGKGAALRAGLSRGRGRYIGFIDADGDLHAAHFGPFLSLMRLYEPDVILGSKRHPLSDLHYPPVRRLWSWGYQQLTRVLFQLNIRDTQTGLKLLRRDVLVAALPWLLQRRFTFDLELLVVARRLGYRRFLEAPVTLRHSFSSTVSARSVAQMLCDTLVVFARLHVARSYGPRTRAIPGQIDATGPASALATSRAA